MREKRKSFFNMIPGYSVYSIIYSFIICGHVILLSTIFYVICNFTE